MIYLGEEVPTSPFKTIYNCVGHMHEFTVVDTALDCEFYIYKGDLEDPILKYIVDTQEVHCLKNGSLMVDLNGMLMKRVNELKEFAKSDWKECVFIAKDDEEFIFDFLEDLVNVIHQGYYSYTEKVVNILKGGAT